MLGNQNKDICSMNLLNASDIIMMSGQLNLVMLQMLNVISCANHTSLTQLHNRLSPNSRAPNANNCDKPAYHISEEI